MNLYFFMIALAATWRMGCGDKSDSRQITEELLWPSG